MNVVFIVVDSLRAKSLPGWGGTSDVAPFLERLSRETVFFRRAHATECWTLPTHLSLFTGLMPSEHGAHFQTMAYRGKTPTLAERATAAGYETEVITRNSLLDGTILGATRGFQRNSKILADLRWPDPLGLLLAFSKPRVRRLIRSSGFFNMIQRNNRAFLGTLARMIIPADRRALEYALERLAAARRGSARTFLFLNLYDVHAPYPPRPDSPLRSFDSVEGWIENLMLPRLSTQLGAHAYLRPGFRFSSRARRILLRRYHDAVRLMDAKLAWFYEEARGAGLLDNSVLIIVSDHGEAFGEHDLYFHDASVYQTHLQVPLWIHHPGVAPSLVSDVVSTRELYEYVGRIVEGGSIAGTLLDPVARASKPVALAEHFFYPHVAGMERRYAQNIATAVLGNRKAIVRAEGLFAYDLAQDPDEDVPEPTTLDAFLDRTRRDGVPEPAVLAAASHLQRWVETARV